MRGRSLILPEDKNDTTAFYFNLICQVIPCKFTEVDRFGKRMSLPLDFPGLACRHCFGDNLSPGRFFPSSIKTIQDGSKTLNSLYHHMMQCHQCPLDVKELLTDTRKYHDADRMKMKVGSQKVFLTRLWNRLHNKDVKNDDHNAETSSTSLKRSRSRSHSMEQDKTRAHIEQRMAVDLSTLDHHHNNARTTPTDRLTYYHHPPSLLFISQFEENHDRQHRDDNNDSSSSKLSQSDSTNITFHTNSAARFPPQKYQMLENPIPLATESDKEWLTPLHCFIRLKCVVLFTATQHDTAPRYQGRRKPVQLGQVGIRCPYCTCHHDKNSQQEISYQDKALDLKNAFFFPQSVGFIHAATMNLLQRHFLNCASIPPSVVHQYKMLQGNAAKSGISKKYWVESALNLGLVDTQHGIRYCVRSKPL